MLSYKNFMISPTELNNILEKNKDVVVIDVRFKEEYNKGHIYNAINISEIFTYLPEGMTTDKEKKDFVDFYENNIKVLDGGYENWCKSDFKTSTKTIHNKETKFIANVDESFFVDYTEMLEIINDEKIITLDVRDKDEWVGISSSPYGIDFAPKKGRLPNAVWIEWYQFITKDMLSVESLDKMKLELLKKDIKVDDDIVYIALKGQDFQTHI